MEALADCINSNVLRILLFHEREKTSQDIYGSKVITCNDYGLIMALDNNCYNFLLFLMKANNYEIVDTFIIQELFNKIKKLFNQDYSHIIIYIYLFHKYDDYIPYSMGHNILEIVRGWLDSQFLRIPFVNSNINPVMIAVLIIELIDQIKTKHSTMEKWAENIIKDLINLSTLLINEVYDHNELHEILMDVDLDGRPLIQIIAFNDILDIFNHKSINSITDRIWSGPYISNAFPDKTSSWIVSNLIHNPLSKIDLFFRSYPKLFSRNYMSYPTNNFQFVAWRDGLQCRYLIESLYYLIVCIYTYDLFYTITCHVKSA